ncbi:hypothetical protein BDR04DRAFT_1111732 [Suillus decipiens]|nr:hypothetical protein BDR04DRAFT_1111732 [Suillus decipiens]
MLEAFKRVPQNEDISTIIICGKRFRAKFWPTESQFADQNGHTCLGIDLDRKRHRNVQSFYLTTS